MCRRKTAWSSAARAASSGKRAFRRSSATLCASRSGKSGTVTEILPRKNSFIRPAVANVDLLVLLASCAIPQTEPFLIDRVLAIAGQQGVEPLICVNKNDLEPGEGLAGIYRRAGFRVVVTSAETGEGIDELRAAFLASSRRSRETPALENQAF